MLSPNGDWLATLYNTAAQTNQVQIIDVRTGRAHTVPGGDVRYVALSDSHLIVQRSSGDLEIWNPAGTVRDQVIVQDASYDSDGSATQSPPQTTGNLIAQERSDGTVALTDTGSGDLIGSLSMPYPLVDNGEKISIEFTSNSSQLVAVRESGPDTDTDGLAVVWSLSPTAWIHAACDSSGRTLTVAEWQRYTVASTHPDLVCAPR